MMTGKAVDNLLVAAIDFGTTYSGYAFSTRFDYQANPLNISSINWKAAFGNGFSQKTPTCILFDSERIFHSFGFKAEDSFMRLAEKGEHHNWLYFKWFKMQLYGKEKLDRKMQIKAYNGKRMDAIKIFSSAILYLKNELIQQSRAQRAIIEDTDILWVLTVPAIWSEPAKQFMRQAAEDAEIPKDQLKIVLEPEAATIYCYHLTIDKLEIGKNKSAMVFIPGSRYLMLDAGGGTIDSTIQEVQSGGTLKEIHRATGGDWGGTSVDQQFVNLLKTLIGSETLNNFQREHPDDWLIMERNFETKKRAVTSQHSTNLWMPCSLQETFRQNHPNVSTESAVENISSDSTWKKDKLLLSSVVMESFFKTSIAKIIDHIRNQLKTTANVSSIVMVGGYSECNILQNAVRSTFKHLKVVVPNEAGLSVLKGAVLNGHAPKIITQRICRYTLGVASSSKFKPGIDKAENKIKGAKGDDRCIDVFKCFVRTGESISIGDSTPPQRFMVSKDTATGIDLPVYNSESSETPRYVTDKGCQKIGVLKIEMPDTSRGKDRGVDVQIRFGGTEIEVKAVDIHTHKETTGNFIFL